MNIIEAIKSISTPPTEKELADFRAKILDLVRSYRSNLTQLATDINQSDESGNTPCHYAAQKSFHLLAILVLDGNAIIPDDLAYPNEEHITQLKEEAQKRRTSHQNPYQRLFHLHDLIRNEKDMKSIKRRIYSHPSEINQRTLYDRTAGHWAALSNKHKELLGLLASKGCDLNAKDLDGKTPYDLIKKSDPKSNPEEVTTMILFTETHSESRIVEEPSESSSHGVQTSAILKLNQTKPKPKPKPKPKRTRSARIWGSLNFSFRGKPIEANVSPSNASVKRSISPTKGKEELVESNLPRLNSRKRPATATLTKQDSFKTPKTSSSFFSSSSSTITDLELALCLQDPRLLEIFKQDNLVEFENHYRIDSENFDKPYLIQALLAGAQNIFCFLVKEGANFSAKYNDKSLIDYVLENNVERLVFLKGVLASLKPESLFEKRSKAQKELKDLEVDFQGRLLGKGYTQQLKGKYDELSKEKLVEICQIDSHSDEQFELVKLVYDLCCGMTDLETPNNTNQNIIQQHVVGLMLNYHPVEIMKILKNLFAHLQVEQQCIALAMMREIILLDHFHLVFRDKNFTTSILLDFFMPTFAEENENKVHADLYQLCRKMIECQKEIQHPLLQCIIQLEDLIAKCDDAAIEMKDPKIFANELRALTCQHLLKVELSEFTNKKWAQATTSPTLSEQTTQFNKLADYIRLFILKATSPEESIKRIKLCINTLHELLYKELPDASAAMAILAALGHSSLLKLMRMLEQKDAEAYGRYLTAQATLDQTKNYKKLRKLMAKAPFAFPYMGCYMRDLTFTLENNDLKSKVSLNGRLLLELIQLRKQILDKRKSILTQSRLAHSIYHHTLRSDEEWILLANRIMLNPIYLETSTLTLFQGLLEIYIERKVPLKVLVQGKVLADSQALEAAFAWLRKQVSEDKTIDLKVITALTEKLNSLPVASASVGTMPTSSVKWLLTQEDLKEQMLTFQFGQLQVQEGESHRNDASVSSTTSPRLN